MRNDLDLIRKILEELERRENAEREVVEIAGWPEPVVARHVERLCNDGLLDAAGSTPGLDDMADIEFFFMSATFPVRVMSFCAPCGQGM